MDNYPKIIYSRHARPNYIPIILLKTSEHKPITEADCEGDREDVTVQNKTLGLGWRHEDKVYPVTTSFTEE